MSCNQGLRIEDALDCSIRSKLHQVTVRLRTVIIGTPNWLLFNRRAVIQHYGRGLSFYENISKIAAGLYLRGGGWRDIARKHRWLLGFFLGELGLRPLQACKEFPQSMLWPVNFSAQVDILLFE